MKTAPFCSCPPFTPSIHKVLLAAPIDEGDERPPEPEHLSSEPEHYHPSSAPATHTSSEHLPRMAGDERPSDATTLEDIVFRARDFARGLGFEGETHTRELLAY